MLRAFIGQVPLQQQPGN